MVGIVSAQGSRSSRKETSVSSMCFASPATLADGIGLYEDKADEEVVKRIARGAAVGIIKPSYQKVMGQERDQLVLEIDFQRVKELAFEMVRPCPYGLLLSVGGAIMGAA